MGFLLHVCVLLWLLALSNGFTCSSRPSAARITPRRQSATSLHALTPVGPFCPFRSASATEMEPRVESMHEAGPEFAKEMAQVQLDMQMGNMPDAPRLLKVAEGLETAVDSWENLITRLRLSQDFQTREYAKLTQAHLDSHGVSVESIASMMRWQAGCMRALANNTPPPMPPPDMDLEKLMSSGDDNTDKPSIAAMTAAQEITSNPFSPDAAVFQEPTVKNEYEALCRDHSALIEFGARYDSFDPLGKLAYLDEVDKIEDRWDVFFARFKLLGALDNSYVEQCNEFLGSMGLDEEGYRDLLKKGHAIMRKEAEAERNQ